MKLQIRKTRPYQFLLLPLLFAALPLSAQRFYPDDPLWREPPPRPAGEVKPQALDNFVDFYKNTFKKKGERNEPGHVTPSQGVNTLDEVPDSLWFTNRHGLKRMTLEELVQGPNVTGPPDMSGPWTVTSAKSEGVTPGFSIRDAKGHRYLLKFDPPTNPELATAADVVGAKFFHDMGYNVPENYIVRFRTEQLQVKPGVKFTDRFDRERDLRQSDLEDLLSTLTHGKDGTVRALASLYIPGKPLGGFKFYKRRGDDINELAPHEHLRVLRGLYTPAAWLNHTDAKSLNSLDVLREEAGRSYVVHYLIDFGASLGSDSLRAKDPRLGSEYFLDWKPGLKHLLGLGLEVPDYARVDYPDQPSVGNFSVEAFHPARWKNNYPNAAFENRLLGDEFWGAKLVTAFTDEEIRAIVHTGQYSDPEAERIISDVLIARRDKIGKEFYSRMAPLDRFRVENGQLQYDDLAAQRGYRPRAAHQISWSRFDNAQGRKEPVNGSGAELPEALRSAGTGTYWAATIGGDPSGKSVTAYLRREASGWKVVGLDREGVDQLEGR